MRKRLVLKLAVTMTALSAMTLLQGCDQEGIGIGMAWAPVGSVPIVGFFFGGTTQGGTGGAGQSAGGGVGGATAGAIGSAAGGGGGQVSGAGVP